MIMMKTIMIMETNYKHSFHCHQSRYHTANRIIGVVELIDAAVSLNNRLHSVPTLARMETDIYIHHTNNHLSSRYYTGT
jgi:hypothetical protein